MSWIYIAGRGHSGSTFLDIVLGNSSEIESFGEIISAIDKIDHQCSCGKYITECPFWHSVILESLKRDKDWIDSLKALIRKSHIKYWPQLFFLGHYVRQHALIKAANNHLYDSMQSRVNTKWILDSSKEPTRALFILTTNPGAKVIQLIRNPIDVTNSYKKRFVKQGYFKFLRKTYYNRKNFFLLSIIIGLSWTFGNLMLELTAWKYKNRILRIRYEDLINNFEGTIHKIEQFIGSNLNDIIRKNESKESFKVGHNIGGNHIKTKKEIFLEKTNSNDETILTKLEKKIIQVTTFPLKQFYKY